MHRLFAGRPFFCRSKADGRHSVQGYALLMCSIYFLGGIQLLGIGILGQYLGKIFIESKRRPDYVIMESCLAPSHPSTAE